MMKYKESTMSRKYLLSLPIIAVSMIVAAVGLFLASCEDSPDTSGLDSYFDRHPYISDPRSVGRSDLEIDPTSATVSYIGEQIHFKVSGGSQPFEWGVADASAGTVEAQPNGREGVYTCVQIDDNNVIASDSEGKAVIADISPETSYALKITPDEITLTAAEGETTVPLPSLANVTVQFTVTGGEPPYGTWTVSTENLGSIDANGLYTVNNTWGIGKNTVSISDSAGAVATASVTTQLAATE